MRIEPTRVLVQQAEIGQPKATEKVVGSFAEALQGLLREVERSDAHASELKRRLLTGEPVELHEVLIATEKAHLAFQTLLAVRNKLLEAYQELTRMPL
ncbi:MAG: flagellar hook-basal body complex protein FliE [Armatimonadetes bacterium]|nr:flagellar hook-basal body complex protein FliE [Armatimonadota bacterium]MCX7969077.1 flagellar hook-basal body complex protein FliE [Armatimonadota bacterium]MDW8142937.1 flagellar hook-basal body complex protein FliE [Armatimonadota bacterium]